MLGKKCSFIFCTHFLFLLIIFAYKHYHDHDKTPALLISRCSKDNDPHRKTKFTPDTMPRSRVPQAQEPKQAGFLDLASEIRNEIYHMWAEDVLHVYVRAKGKAYTTAAHPATNVSHMVHREFTGVLAQTAVENAQKVNVGIEDFDFSPAIA